MNKAAPRSLKDVFNSFAADAVERFPQLRGKFLIMDMNEHILYGLEDLDTDATRLTEASALRFVSLHPTTRQLEDDKDLTSRAIYDRKHDISILFVNDEIDPVSMRSAMHVMDHELGHLGIAGSLYSEYDTPEELKGECIADAYALIRHFQRFGAETDCKDKYVSPFARARALIFNGHGGHFTSFVLDEIIKRRQAIDFASLTPAQTAAMAVEYTEQFMPSMATVQKLQTAFAPVKAAWEEDTTQGVKALIDITLRTEDPDVFRTGRIWLEKFTHYAINFHDDAPALPKAELKRTARELERRAYHFEYLEREAAAPKGYKWRAFLGLSPA